MGNRKARRLTLYSVNQRMRCLVGITALLTACAGAPSLEPPLVEEAAPETAATGAKSTANPKTARATVTSAKEGVADLRVKKARKTERLGSQPDTVARDEASASPSLDAGPVSEAQELLHQQRLARIANLERQIAALAVQIGEVEVENQWVSRLLQAATQLRDALVIKQARFAEINTLAGSLDPVDTEQRQRLEAEREVLSRLADC